MLLSRNRRFVACPSEFLYIEKLGPPLGRTFFIIPMSPQRIGIFGSTGSIGRSTLDVIRKLPDRFRVSFLTTNSSIDTIEDQVREFSPGSVAVMQEHLARELRSRLSSSVSVAAGVEGLLSLARAEGTDIVVSALVGFAGVLPTAEAIRNGKHIALANKETLVAAGAHVTGLAKKHGVRLVPVDSEHSAILQCLVGEEPRTVSRLILTASGGPFRDTPAADFESITIEQALNHPNWTMGQKVTIDSATLMNKGLEVIEAHWLFGLPRHKIEVVIHPQSIIHSMVEFIDGSIKAQLGVPDMKLPIQYALTYPDRVVLNEERVDFARLREMTFSAPDTARFPSLRIAYEALDAGGTYPAVLNAGNEVAVRAFLEGRTSFASIPRILEDTMSKHQSNGAVDIEAIIDADGWARRTADEAVHHRALT